MTEISEPLYIVTGASAGIGRAVAIALSARECRVIAVARTKQLLESLSSQCGPRLSTVAADLSNSSGIEQVVAAFANDSEIAGIVHAAGSLVPLEPYVTINSGELTEHFRIHVGAPIALYQAVSQSLPICRMLFIDSYSASTPRIGWGAYSIVKSAAQMAARCAAEELPGTETIRVYPGAVNTQIVDAVLASNTETAKTFAGMKERGEFAQPAEAAAFIVALLVDASDEVLRSRSVWDYNSPEDRECLESEN